jgi:hypothetical protein
MPIVSQTLPDASPLEQLQAALARQQSLLDIQIQHLALQDEEIAQQGRHIRDLLARLDFMCRMADTLPVAVGSSRPARPARSLYALPSLP